MSDNHSSTGERTIRRENSGGAVGAMPPRPNSGPDPKYGQGTPPIMDGHGRDGMHRENPSTRAVPDNGMRTRTPEGIEVGMKSGHDIQDSVPKPPFDADTSTEVPREEEESAAEKRMEGEGRR